MANAFQFTPANDLFRLQREFDQLFNTLFPAPRVNDDEKASWSPRADIVQTEDAYELRLDLPGVPREDIEINFHEGTLTVSGSRKAAHADEKQSYVRQERVYGRFFRSFKLLEAVDPNRIEAIHENGELRVRLHKAEESKPRRITIS